MISISDSAGGESVRRASDATTSMHRREAIVRHGLGRHPYGIACQRHLPGNLMHHTHHGYGKDGASYRNYAVTFAFIDWMFGTLHIPSGRPWRYGISGAQPHWAEEIFYPLVRIPGKAEDAVKGDATEETPAAWR